MTLSQINKIELKDDIYISMISFFLKFEGTPG